LYPIEQIPPCLDPSIYVSSSGLSIVEAIVGSVRSAQFLQRLAENCIESAQRQCACELFFEDLFTAGAYLLAAQRLHAATEHCAKHRGNEITEKLSPVIQEGMADAVLVEEYLAHIATSFFHATLSREDAETFHELDFTDRLQFETWVTVNAGVDPRATAELLTDAYIRLAIPRFLLDLGKGLINTEQHRHLPRTKVMLEHISAKLEAILPISMLLSEPDFLRLAYSVLSKVNNEQGLIEDGQLYSYRSSDEYFTQRLKEVEAGWSNGTVADRISEVLKSGKDQFFYEGTP
jgi:hypothetical protein